MASVQSTSKQKKARKKSKEKALSGFNGERRSDLEHKVHGVDSTSAEVDREPKENGLITGIEERDREARNTCPREVTATVSPANSDSTSKKKKKAKKVSAEPSTTAQCSLPNSSSSLDEELEWCIAQLELGMLKTGANKTQKQQNEKNIHTLRGPKTSLPKKRQLMRSLFGDYRSKMKTQPLPESFVTKEVKLEAVKPEVLETVGTYFRKSLHSGPVDEPSHVVCDFKFDFTIH